MTIPLPNPEVPTFHETKTFLVEYLSSVTRITAVYEQVVLHMMSRL